MSKEIATSSAENKTEQELVQEQNAKVLLDEEINEQVLDQLLTEGRVLFNELKFDEAQTKFQEALVKGIKFYQNEVAVQLSKFYYSYGNTLLAKVQKQHLIFLQIESQSEILGEKVKKIVKKKDTDQVIDDVVIQEENSKEQVSNDKLQSNEDKDIENQAEEYDDIEISWENLEVARTLTEKELDLCKSNDDEEKNKIIKNLAKIKLRQGDLQAINDDFDYAIQEYNECLQLRLKVECIETSRELAEIYFLLGNANLYKNVINSEQIALKFFAKATNCLQALLEKELNLTGKLFTEKDKELKSKQLNREPLKESFLDNSNTKELKSILNMMYDKIEDTLEQLSQKGQFEKEKQDALLSSQGFPSTIKTEQKQVINLGVIKGTGGKKKIIIPTPVQQKNQNQQQLEESKENQKDKIQEKCEQNAEVVRKREDGYPEKKIKLD